jgi:hypothetical protein
LRRHWKCRGTRKGRHTEMCNPTPLATSRRWALVGSPPSPRAELPNRPGASLSTSLPKYRELARGGVMRPLRQSVTDRVDDIGPIENL